MGLDSVEIVVDIEEKFGIEIPDKNAVNLVTVGQLCDFVWSSLENHPKTECIYQLLFFRLRKFFSTECGIRSSDFTPQSKIESLLKGKERKFVWAKLTTLFQIEFPRISNNWITKNLFLLKKQSTN